MDWKDKLENLETLPLDLDISEVFLEEIGVAPDESEGVLTSLQEKGLETWGGLLALKSEEQTINATGDEVSGERIWNFVQDQKRKAAAAQGRWIDQLLLMFSVKSTRDFFIKWGRPFFTCFSSLFFGERKQESFIVVDIRTHEWTFKESRPDRALLLDRFINILCEVFQVPDFRWFMNNILLLEQPYGWLDFALIITSVYERDLDHYIRLLEAIIKIMEFESRPTAQFTEPFILLGDALCRGGHIEHAIDIFEKGIRFADENKFESSVLRHRFSKFTSTPTTKNEAIVFAFSRKLWKGRFSAPIKEIGYDNEGIFVETEDGKSGTDLATMNIDIGSFQVPITFRQYHPRIQYARYLSENVHGGS